MKMKDFALGSRLRICGYDTVDRGYRQKLLRMGLIRGAVFTLTRRAPMGDPLEISLNGSNLSLRKHEADALKVEVDR
jgi:ferrous iron transport protein A